MLEYDIDEAQALLEKNLSTATRNLESLEEDLDFLRDQFTTTEVSILSIRVQLKVKRHNCIVKYCDVNACIYEICRNQSLGGKTFLKVKLFGCLGRKGVCV